ncbi:hypothetical protein ACWCQN_47850, partial [Streptomyces sp. NPDC001984]
SPRRARGGARRVAARRSVAPQRRSKDGIPHPAEAGRPLPRTGMDDLIEPIATPGAAKKPKKAAAGGTTVSEGVGELRPRRARITGVER